MVLVHRLQHALCTDTLEHDRLCRLFPPCCFEPSTQGR